MSNIDSTVFAFSDGAALGNPGPSGYGIILRYKGVVRELSAGYRYSTNNRMELLGAIIALETLNRPCRVILATDSRYVVDGVSEGWAASWRARGWRRGKGGRVLNPDLWGRLLDAISHHNVTFKWVAGHEGHPENERCDQLANEAARSTNLAVDEQYEKTINASLKLI